MIIRQISFVLDISLSHEFELFWKTQYRAAMAKQPGFVAARLLGAAENAAELQIEIEFENEESAAAWRVSEEHEALKPRFKQYIPSSSLKVFLQKA